MTPRLPWARLPRLVTWVVLTVIILGPLYWITISSFKGRQEILRRTPTLFPTDPTLDNFQQLFSATDYPTYLTNSVVIGLLTTLCTVVVSVLAAFGLYRVRIPGGDTLAVLILVAYMIPGTLLLVPLYQSLAAVRLIDTPNALVLVNVAFTAPFCTRLQRGFLRAIPRDLDEAAAVDGAGPVRSLVRIILPLLAPGVAAIAIYAFVFSWTEFVFASQLVVSDNLKTLPIGLSEIMGQYTVNWGLLMAGTVCTVLPAIIPFLLVGRHFVGGLTTGAVR